MYISDLQLGYVAFVDKEQCAFQVEPYDSPIVVYLPVSFLLCGSTCEEGEQTEEAGCNTA